jgi:hypothetical protein
VTHSSHSSGLSIRWSWVRVPAASLILTTSNRPLGTGQARAAVPLVVRSSRATASLSSPTCRSFGASRAGIGGADEPSGGGSFVDTVAAIGTVCARRQKRPRSPRLPGR